MDILKMFKPNIQGYILAVIKKLIIKPTKKDFLSLAGRYKVKNPIPVEKIRDYIEYF